MLNPCERRKERHGRWSGQHFITPETPANSQDLTTTLRRTAPVIYLITGSHSDPANEDVKTNNSMLAHQNASSDLCLTKWLTSRSAAEHNPKTSVRTHDKQGERL